MPKTKKIINLQSTQDLITRMAGEGALKVIKIYERKGEDVTDEELAKKMKLKVTEVRTILNRLHYRGVACYQKSKNSKTGWYSYTWAIKKKRIAEILLEEIQENVKKLETKQQMQSNYGWFSCRAACGPMPFEIAAEYGFRCPECGKVMGMMNNTRVLKETETELGALRAEQTIIKKAL